MSSARSQELMNKNSQHEFRFTSQDGFQIACTRWPSPEFDPICQCISFSAAKIQLASNRKAFARSLSAIAKLESAISHDFCEGGRHEMLKELKRGQVRANTMVRLSSVLHDQSRNREALWPR
jgi:hypothetical protein